MTSYRNRSHKRNSKIRITKKKGGGWLLSENLKIPKYRDAYKDTLLELIKIGEISEKRLNTLLQNNKYGLTEFTFKNGHFSSSETNFISKDHEKNNINNDIYFVQQFAEQWDNNIKKRINKQMLKTYKEIPYTKDLWFNKRSKSLDFFLRTAGEPNVSSKSSKSSKSSNPSVLKHLLDVYQPTSPPIQSKLHAIAHADRDRS